MIQITKKRGFCKYVDAPCPALISVIPDSTRNPDRDEDFDHQGAAVAALRLRISFREEWDVLSFCRPRSLYTEAHRGGPGSGLGAEVRIDRFPHYPHEPLGRVIADANGCVCEVRLVPVHLPGLGLAFGKFKIKKKLGTLNFFTNFLMS